MKEFTDMLFHIYEDHKTGVMYGLNDESQQLYDSLNDEYKRHMIEKFENSFEDDEEEEDFHSSKESIHLLKICGLIHILNVYMEFHLRGNRTVQFNLPTVMGLSAMAGAREFIHVTNQHRMHYCQVSIN